MQPSVILSCSRSTVSIVNFQEAKPIPHVLANSTTRIEWKPVTLALFILLSLGNPLKTPARSLPPFYINDLGVWAAHAVANHQFNYTNKATKLKSIHFLRVKYEISHPNVLNETLPLKKRPGTCREQFLRTLMRQIGRREPQ